MAKKAYNELDYAYAVARLSALENRLLGGAELEKLVSAESEKEAAAMLKNLGRRVSDNFEDMLENELSEVFSLIESLGGGEFLKTQRVKYDYHNIKALVKGELTSQSVDGVFVSYGSISVSGIKNAVINRDYKALSDNMKSALALAYDQYARVADVRLIDIIFDKALLGDMWDYANNQPDEKILDLIKTQIDMHNIQAFVRIRKMGMAHVLAERVIAEGGHIPVDFYTGHNALSKESESDIFSRTMYSKAFINGENLEKELDSIFIEKVKKARLGAFGLAPLAAYFWLKENEIRNIRIILTCKRAGISTDLIRQRLRG